MLAVFLLQYLFTYLQMNSFKRYFSKYIKRGKVCIGIRKGGVKKGAIVMFSIDDIGNIKKYAYLYGLTSFARFKESDIFNKLNINDLDDEILKELGFAGNLKLAILNAKDNFNKVKNGEKICEKKTIFQNMRHKLINNREEI
ncbi:MAG: transcriptional regulator GutM [Anaerococcus sp.]|nr:transcriptional regulator GutM [Anaerococcus sp.]